MTDKPKTTETEAADTTEPLAPDTTLTSEVPLSRMLRLQTHLKVAKVKAIDVALSPYRFFKVFCFSVGLVTILIVTGISFAITGFFSSLPEIDEMPYSDIRKVAETHVVAKLEDKSKKYRWVGIRDVHRDLIYSVVISEDGEFFSHDGLNYEAILQAAAKNYKKKEFATGASTITQQVAKNLFLTSEKSILRKVKEFFIAKALESKYSKNQIMELYLNIAEFGPDIYGVRAASWKLFKKRPNKINAGEAAFMTIMLPSPRKNHYSIVVKGNMSRKNSSKIKRILRGMLYKEFISNKEYKRYSKYRNYAH